jgi:hypothetical protein
MLGLKQISTRLPGRRASHGTKHVRRSGSRTSVLRLECLEPRLALSGLNLTFAIENPNYNPSNVYVTFLGGTLEATYSGSQTVQLNQSYTIAQLNGPVNITKFDAGRVFVSYGAGVAGTDPPEPVNPDIPSYSVRHDKIEITYKPKDQSGVADLTAVDFFAIPMELNTYQNGSATPVQTLTYNISANSLTSQIAALAGDSNQVLLTDQNGNFLRVLSPHTPSLDNIDHFPSMVPYIDRVIAWQNEGHPYTTIADTYSNSKGTTPRTTTQNYSFQATVTPDGGLQLVGGGQVVGGGPYGGTNHIILIAAADLPNNIYLGNPPWTVDGVPGSFADNDVYAAAVRDVLSGFNLGFMASKTPDPNHSNVPFGEESSSNWWSSQWAFDYLQPEHPYYNQYAKIVTSNSNAYSWAFSDRWSAVQANLYGMDTLQVVILPDTSQTSPGLYDATAGTFYLRDTNSTGIADVAFTYGPANSGWKPITGHWNQAAGDTIGLYDPTASNFYLRNNNDTGIADIAFTYGPANSGWTPITGDWDGNGIDTIGLYNPATSMFFLRNSNTTGTADEVFTYGPPNSGWTPVVGQWTNTAGDTIGLYDPTTSMFYLRNSNTTGMADAVFTYGPPNSGWMPLTGSWTANGIDTVGLYRPTDSTFFLRNSNTTGTADAVFTYGPPSASWTPITGSWSIGGTLLAAGGAVAASNQPTLTQAELQPIVGAAIARWAAAGLDPASVARMQRVEVVIDDLAGSLLGQAGAKRVCLDSNAAGRGWFVDLTPASDEEFALAPHSRLLATDPRAIDRIDLLTVVEHELGHVVGFHDLDAASDSLMSGELGVGARRNASL